MHPSTRRAILAGSFALAILIPSLASAEPIDNLVESLLQKLDTTSREGHILEAAERLFIALAGISLVWTMGLLILRQDIGEMLMELVRFLVVTGTFYWLLINASDLQGGKGFVMDIVNSFFQLGSSSPDDTSMRRQASGLLGQGLFVYYTVVLEATGGDMADRLLAAGLAIGILVVTAFVAGYFVLALAMAWMLGYAGIFLLGFGGARWTSGIAVNFYKHVLALGLVILALSFIAAVGANFFDDIRSSSITLSGGPAEFGYLGAMLAGSIMVLVLSTKLPQLLYTLVTGSTLGFFSGTASLAGSAIAAAGSSARASVGGGPLAGASGSGTSVGSVRAESVMDAVQRSSTSAGGTADPFHVGVGSDPFGSPRKMDSHRPGGNGSVFRQNTAPSETFAHSAPDCSTVESVVEPSARGQATPARDARYDSQPQRGKVNEEGIRTASEPAVTAHAAQGQERGDAGSQPMISDGPALPEAARTEAHIGGTIAEGHSDRNSPVDPGRLDSASVSSSREEESPLHDMESRSNSARVELEERTQIDPPVTSANAIDAMEHYPGMETHRGSASSEIGHIQPPGAVSRVERLAATDSRAEGERPSDHMAQPGFESTDVSKAVTDARTEASTKTSVLPADSTEQIQLQQADVTHASATDSQPVPLAVQAERPSEHVAQPGFESTDVAKALTDARVEGSTKTSVLPADSTEHVQLQQADVKHASATDSRPVPLTVQAERPSEHVAQPGFVSTDVAKAVTDARTEESTERPSVLPAHGTEQVQPPGVDVTSSVRTLDPAPGVQAGQALTGLGKVTEEGHARLAKHDSDAQGGARVESTAAANNDGKASGDGTGTDHSRAPGNGTSHPASEIVARNAPAHDEMPVDKKRLPRAEDPE